MMTTSAQPYSDLIKAFKVQIANSLKDNLYLNRLIPQGKGIRYPKGYGPLVPEGICWHWTANTGYGAGADNHWLYWHRSKYGAHYVVDDEKIIKCAPHNEVIWHAGPSSLYTDYIKRRLPRGANLSLIGVELCVNKDSDWNTTYRNAVALGTYLCAMYNWTPENNFFRHYDCTKKDCPRMMTPYVSGGQEYWETFKRDVQLKLSRGDKALTKFKDVIGHWAEGDITYLEERGIVSGKEKDKFYPNDTITRAEVCAVVHRAIDYVLKEVNK